MAYDDVILRMGEFGRYQRRVYLLLCLPAISCAFHKLAGVFLGAKMDSRYNAGSIANSSVIIIINACHKLRYITRERDLSRRCLLPHEHAANATFFLSQDVWNASYPWDYEVKGWSQCLSRDVSGVPWSNDTIVDEAIGDGAVADGISRCRQYVYDRSIYKSTTTSEVRQSFVEYIFTFISTTRPLFTIM